MAGIFPPGGVPPAPEVCEGYTPVNPVTGVGPLYAAPECTTTLTDCTFNAIVSEILASVDLLGVPYNSGRVDNLGRALADRFDHVTGLIDARILRSGDAMTGPLSLAGDPVTDLQAATKRYVDQRDAALLQQVDNTKVSRSGDQMSGVLLLHADPIAGLEAATKQYVDSQVGDAIIEPPADLQTYGRVHGSWVPVLPITGGTITGALNVREPVANTEAATKYYVDALVAQGGTFVDAPADDFVYGRLNHAWARVLPIAGGTMTGPLTLVGSPQQPLQPVTLQYLNSQLTSLNETVNANLANKVNRAGDVMAGVLDMNVAAATNAWSVNAGVALARGDGTGLFTSPFDIRAAAGAPNPRLRFLNSGGTGVSEVWHNTTANALRFRIGAADNAEIRGYGLYLGASLDAGMFLEGGASGSDFYIRANTQYYFRYNTGNLYWMTPLGAGFACDTNRNVSIGRDLVVGAGAFKPGGGPWTDTSDIRIKDRVVDYTNGLDAIRSLRPVSYHFLPATGRDSEREHIGLVAQEAEPVMPECVSQQKITLGDLQLDDMRMLDTGPIVFALINAVKTLADDNDQLRARLAALEKGRKR